LRSLFDRSHRTSSYAPHASSSRYLGPRTHFASKVGMKFMSEADAQLDNYLQRLDQGDAAESAAGGTRVKNLAEKIAALRDRRDRHQALLAELDRTGESQISLSRVGSRRGPGFA